MKSLPWEIKRSVSSSEYGVTIVNSRREIVCSTYEEYAKLLKAAPALLLALQRLKADALAILQHKTVRAFDETLAEVDAAIAEAENK